MRIGMIVTSIRDFILAEVSGALIALGSIFVFVVIIIVYVVCCVLSRTERHNIIIF
jgi:hypothetical protein